MNKIALSIVAAGLIVGISVIFFGGSRNSQNDYAQNNQNVEIRDGVQYVTINARGGYLPRVSSAQAGIPTKLVVKTSGTYDCSAALAIRSIGYQKVLPQTGEEVIYIGTSQARTSLKGTCSMGMYSFAINFN